jgi:hypothetical protein
MTWTYYRFTPESNSAQGAEAELLTALSKLSPEQARTALAVIYHDDGESGASHPVLIYNDSPDSGAHAQDLPLGWGHLQYNPAQGYEATVGAICDLLNGKPLHVRGGQTVTLDASQASLVKFLTYYPPITPNPHLNIYYPTSTQQSSRPSSSKP